jgi:membrane-associated protease RseP (regulator of RpoE activity)
MFAGPFMNLILAVVLFLGVMMTFGINTTTTTVSTVEKCVVKVTEHTDTSKCPKGAKKTPANQAGLQPGDKIVSFQGKKITEWQQLQRTIRDSSGDVTFTVRRDGDLHTLHASLIQQKVHKLDGHGGYVKGEYVTTGFLGFSPASGVQQLSFTEATDRMGEMMATGVDRMLEIPAKVPGLWDAVFNDGERAQDSPMGVVGAARVGGEIFTLDIPASQQVAFTLFLVAGFNLSLFLFNMLPLLPLDGGHIAGALWESLRRAFARVFRRPDPGPFDVAKLMPVAYVVASVFICFTLLVMAADIVNPVRLTG